MVLVAYKIELKNPKLDVIQNSQTIVETNIFSLKKKIKQNGIEIIKEKKIMKNGIEIIKEK